MLIRGHERSSCTRFLLLAVVQIQRLITLNYILSLLVMKMVFQQEALQ